MVSLIIRIAHIIRYRFLLFAGILPYILGQAIAFQESRVSFSPFYSLVGLVGIGLVLIGVETFNEYFDSKIGTDRVFQLEHIEVSGYTLKLGILTFSMAFIIALYLSTLRRPLIILFAFLGFLIAAFYVTPPIKWAYRGLGEFVIFLAYGPLMTQGSFYLQTGKLSFVPLIVSLIPGLLVMSLCIINEIPDYFQDKLVGKRNIVVRLGKVKAIIFYQMILISCFIILALGLVLKIFPFFSVFIFLTFPLAYRAIVLAKEYYNCTADFITAIRLTVFLYTITIILFSITYFFNR